MAKKYFDNHKLQIAYDYYFSNIECDTWEKIHSVLNITSGDILPKRKMIEGKYQVYGGGGITNNSHNEFNIDYETIGIGRVGARCGCVFNIEKNSWVTDNSLLVKSFDGRLSLNFLKHYLNYQNLGQFANNAMQPVISKTRISSIKLPIIDLVEQNKIANNLDILENNTEDYKDLDDDLLSKISVVDKWKDLTIAIQTQKQLLVDLKQAILQEAIQGKLTQEWREQNSNTEPASKLLERIKAEKEQLIKDKKIRKEKPLSPIIEEEIPFKIPESWIWCKIGEIYQSTSGGTPTRGNQEYWAGNIKWYKSGELNDGLLSIDSKEHITNQGLKKSSATLFPKGTLLIAMYGATAGKLAILNSDATTNQAVCGFFENKMLSTDYLFYFFRASREKMIKESWGMSQPNISQTYLKNFVFALPPFEEQKAIVEKVETLMQKCNELEQEITQSEEHANMLMQAVLKEAFESKTETVTVS